MVSCDIFSPQRQSLLTHRFIASRVVPRDVVALLVECVHFRPEQDALSLFAFVAERWGSELLVQHSPDVRNTHQH